MKCDRSCLEVGRKRIFRSLQTAVSPTLTGSTAWSFLRYENLRTVQNNPAQDPSELLVKASVREQHAIEQTTFYIEPNFDMISIGHGMCSGAFVFENDSLTYEVTFSFMDASGNETMYEGEPIPFTKPTIPSNRD